MKLLWPVKTEMAVANPGEIPHQEEEVVTPQSSPILIASDVRTVAPTQQRFLRPEEREEKNDVTYSTVGKFRKNVCLEVLVKNRKKNVGVHGIFLDKK